MVPLLCFGHRETAHAACAGVAFRGKEWDQLYHCKAQLLEALMFRYYADMPTMHCMFPRGGGWLQEDNARPHKSKVAAAFREERRLRVLSWLAQSPDLNPIENLCPVVKRSIHKPKTKPTKLAELERYVKAIWKAIPKSTMENLVDSMPD